MPRPFPKGELKGDCPFHFTHPTAAGLPVFTLMPSTWPLPLIRATIAAEEAAMYQPHPACNTPPADAVLWRYTDLAKFLSFLDSGKLWFASVDTLGDPFEGSSTVVDTQSTASLIAAKLESLTPSERIVYMGMLGMTPQAYGEGQRRTRQFFGENTMVNCWCRSAEESDALWRVYASPQYGIAMKTTFHSLCESLICPDEVHVGVVQYIDYHKEHIPPGNVFHYYLRKRLAFEHEHEVRAFHLHKPDTLGQTPAGQPVSWSQTLTGKYLQVDIPSLVNAVVVAPFAPEWFLDMTKSVVTRYGFKFPVIRSSLSEEPVY